MSNWLFWVQFNLLGGLLKVQRGKVCKDVRLNSKMALVFQEIGFAQWLMTNGGWGKLKVRAPSTWCFRTACSSASLSSQSHFIRVCVCVCVCVPFCSSVDKGDFWPCFQQVSCRHRFVLKRRKYLRNINEWKNVCISITIVKLLCWKMIMG